MANLSALTKTPTTQLPVDWYFSQKIYELEMKLLFEQGPGYIGHELMVPEMSDFHTLEWMGHGKTLVRNANGVELLSNVCRHRQAVMLKGRGKADHIVCPLHRWTYDSGGKLLGAPHFPGNPCLDLGKTPLQNWNGLLFSSPRDIHRDLASAALARDFDFTGYLYHGTRIDEYDVNWKAFIEVYLEDYHVVPFHPGLGQFVDCEGLEWEFGDWYSVQTVGVYQQLGKPGTRTYKRWHDAVLKYYGGEPPPHGAIWLTYYPNIMVEWYPHVLVISTILPRGVDKCTNVVEFYYPEDIALFEPDFVEAEQAAYAETAEEDKEICNRMQEGRQALWLRGDNEIGPYQSPMEDGMVHFHEFLRRHLDPALAAR
ncbi:MAG: aromatic ring-hydroxylating dioxygenase subunit alpha [Burkholderiales bacterium]|nr:aromatic ring-hydroxylating dioxygenase subunit alpha [Burkholderiales bacterium]